MKQFEEYFNINALSDEFKETIKPQYKEIKELLSDEMVLISGDFYGIQKFIFEGLGTKNASKVLRAKSAYIQLFSNYLAKYICFRLGLDEQQILSVTAGKFEILAPSSIDIDILTDIHNKVDTFFIKNFFGLAGVGISYVKCSRDDFLDTNRYKELREKVAKSVELKKFKKFNLTDKESTLSYDEGINNQNLCPICNIRKGKDGCSICKNFVRLGELLVKKESNTLTNIELGINIDDSFIIDLKIDNSIKFYVAPKSNKPRDFESLAQSSCDDLDTGIKALAVLKADVDGMGNFIKESDVTDSFENFYLFSNGLNDFFSQFVPKYLRKKYRDSYTVFTGGDDLFIIGAWDEMLKFARELQDIFKKYVKNKLTISFGIAVIKPSYPVARIAEITEEMLEDAKEVEGKDAITLFGESVKWKSYLNTYKKLDATFKNLKKEEEKTALLYRLLEFTSMSNNVKENIKNTIWKSKINYLFNRNMSKDSITTILPILDESIEKYPKESKMFLSEYIYTRRKV